MNNLSEEILDGEVLSILCFGIEVDLSSIVDYILHSESKAFFFSEKKMHDDVLILKYHHLFT